MLPALYTVLILAASGPEFSGSYVDRPHCEESAKRQVKLKKHATCIPITEQRWIEFHGDMSKWDKDALRHGRINYEDEPRFGPSTVGTSVSGI